ncbi:MAG: glycosyltransferase family 2 protein [Lachnospiraceae bacterium]|nr:glycosyltransferase family 2 protein [Lachnospiraceae bacterium]
MDGDKKISVIMGIYNCANTLEEAVKSIQDQTYANWELIMCDDGSTDNTYDVASQLKSEDKRIILLKNDRNRCNNNTLNHCLKKATGHYIARMDGDDICVPERFEKQVKRLEKGEYAIVSTAMFFYDETGTWGRNHVLETPGTEQIVLNSEICHAPVMLKKECMDLVRGYTVDHRMLRVEDVNLWIKLYAKGFRCYNIQEPLYGMRNDRNASNRRKYIYRMNEVYVRWLGCKEFHLGLVDYIKCMKPLIAGLIPSRARMLIRRKQQVKNL